MTPSTGRQPIENKGRYLLSVEEIPWTFQDTLAKFPAYFIGSTAPNNVEDGVGKVSNPTIGINQIAADLSARDNAELLIVVHGYNTALGEFSADGGTYPGKGIKGWYQDIRDHIATHCYSDSSGPVLIGYRWPSEEVKGKGSDSFGQKFRYAQQSLPIFFRVLIAIAFAILFVLVVGATFRLSESLGFDIVGIVLLVLATLLLSFVLTLFLLRIVGYFRDSYRATYYGVPDLVELIRQLDKAVFDQRSDSEAPDHKIKLSFIGHSMGAFVVTNTVRILSDVFDRQSIGSLGTNNKEKTPSSAIGNVFSLGRLVLVAPDIPAETIISGRANFLSSSLRRFEETYLFSNEGDMALRLAATAANYASFPSKTREGGYRLGNVVVRSPQPKLTKSQSVRHYLKQYGIINFDPNGPDGGHLLDVQPRTQDGFKPRLIVHQEADGRGMQASSFLEYLYILRDESLSNRQQDILESEQKPIAELFTVFDCTDYIELSTDGSSKGVKKKGLLTYALGRRSLSFWNYISLTFAMVSGKIDTHSGYFQSDKPEAQVSKQLIYGLACLGFKPLIASLSSSTDSKDHLAALSELCATRQIQVLLAAERYNRDILGIETEGDRDGY